MQKKSRDIPQTLKCPMCNNKLKVWHCAGQRIGKLQVELSVWLSLLQEAMLLPCCKKSACRSCAERGLMKSRKNGKFTCNQCGSDRYAIKDLEPNYTLRAVIDELTRTQRKTQPHVRGFFLICHSCPLLRAVLFCCNNTAQNRNSLPISLCARKRMHRRCRGPVRRLSRRPSRRPSRRLQTQRLISNRHRAPLPPTTRIRLRSP